MDVFPLTFHRLSIRAYENKPVEDEKMMMILKAGQKALSAVNNQPCFFRVQRSGAGQKT